MPKRFFLGCFISCAAAAFTAVAAFAFSLPESPSGYVNDYAQMLSGSAKASLEAELSQFEKETSTQIFLATFPSLEGEALEDVSIRLFEKWKPGQKNKDNGVLLLIFRDDRQLRIEVGYGLEGALPDLLAKAIIEREIVPSFKAGRVDEGVGKGLSAIMRAVKGEYTASSAGRGPSEDFVMHLLFLILFFYMSFPYLAYPLVVFLTYTLFGFPAGIFAGLGAVFVMHILRLFFGKAALDSHTYRGGSRRGGGWSGGSFGGGGFGGGGFGGGGGGMGGGGGASGRW